MWYGVLFYAAEAKVALLRSIIQSSLDRHQMSSGSVRRITSQEIQLVQDLIERCLQLYMNRKEVEEALYEHKEIDPRFTELVWQKLEEANKEFFNAYYQRLVVKHQIAEFNKLLGRQAQLMREMGQTGVATAPTSNGSHGPALDQNASYFAAEVTGAVLKLEMHNPDSHANMLSGVDISSHADRVSASPTILSAHCSHVNVLPVINGGMVRSEAGYSESSPCMFCTDCSILRARAIGDTCASSSGSVEPSLEAIPGLYLDTTQCGSLNTIPTLPDFSIDLSQYSDNYSRPYFPATDSEQFVDPREIEQVEHKEFESVSSGLSYEEIRHKYLT